MFGNTIAKFNQDSEDLKSEEAMEENSRGEQIHNFRSLGPSFFLDEVILN